MMDIFEFMKAIEIEGTDTQVTMLGDDIKICWDFEVTGHPTLTHKRVSRLTNSHMIGMLHLLVDDVKHIIEVNRNAQ